MPRDCTGRSLSIDEGYNIMNSPLYFEVDPMNRNKKAVTGPKMSNKIKKTKVSTSSASMAKPRQSVAAAYSSGQHSGKPMFLKAGADSTRIRHRELLTNVTGSVNFTVASSIALNPGLPTSFPWLATQAQGWEKYQFQKLDFCYYTRTGSNIPGSVQLVPDYDASDAAPASEIIASAYADVEEDAPWKDICCKLDVNCLRDQKLYIRTGGLSANQDIKTYDVGNMFLTTTDGTAVAWGKLWVEYDIILYNPQLPSGGAAGTGTLQGAGGSLAAATPFGAVPVPVGPYSLNAAATNVISFSGLSIGVEYSLSAFITGTTITACSGLGGTITGGTLKTSIGNGFNSAATNGFAAITFTATATSGTSTLSVTAATVTSSEVLLSALTPTPAF
jgi:hypothetical protein